MEHSLSKAHQPKELSKKYRGAFPYSRGFWMFTKRPGPATWIPAGVQGTKPPGALPSLATVLLPRSYHVYNCSYHGAYNCSYHGAYNSSYHGAAKTCLTYHTLRLTS